MTINSTVRTAGPFIGTNTTPTYPFAFTVYQGSDLYLVETESGTDVPLVYNTDYTVALNADQVNNPGGSITLIVMGVPTNLAIGNKLTMTSQVPQTQGQTITNLSRFFPSIITTALDRLTILVQQLSQQLFRGITIPLSDGTSINTTLPNATTRANSFLGFDASGNVQIVAAIAGAPVSAAMLPVLNASTTTIALNLLLNSTALTIAQGGTGATTALGAMQNIGAGVNSLTYRSTISPSNDAFGYYSAIAGAYVKCAMQDLFKFLIPAFSSKGTPVAADILNGLDSASSNNPVRFTIAQLFASAASLINTIASAAGGAGLNIPHGAAPTSPNNGDTWTTTAGMFARINGATVGPFSGGSSGPFRLLGSVSASSGSSALTFSSALFDQTNYDMYLIIFDALIQSAASRVDLQYSLDSGATWTGQAGTQLNTRTIGGSTNTVTGVAAGTTGVQLNTVTTTASDINGKVWINFPSSSDYPYLEWLLSNSTDARMSQGVALGSVSNSIPFSACRLVPSTGTFAVNKAMLYGIRNN